MGSEAGVIVVRMLKHTALASSVGLLFTGLLAVMPASAETLPPDFTPQPPTEAAKTPITVGVPIRTINTPGTSGQSGIVEMQVGSSAPMSVMLDTGSVGLRLWSGVRPGMTMTAKRVSSTTGGANVRGLLGSAPMTIGGVTTTVDVPLQLINTSNPYINGWKARNISGILGIGVGSGELTNPLVAMPGELGLRWSVHFTRNTADTSGRVGALILGAAPPGNADMHFRLPYVGVNVNGARLWDDHAANGCWTFGTAREYCVPTWFDSGFTVMRVKGRMFSSLPTAAGKQLRPGTRVGLAAGSSAFTADTFRAGNTASRNLARVTPSGKPTINTGNSFYFEYTVTYNVATGDIYLSKPPRKRK